MTKLFIKYFLIVAVCFLNGNLLSAHNSKVDHHTLSVKKNKEAVQAYLIEGQHSDDHYSSSPSGIPQDNGLNDEAEVEEEKEKEDSDVFKKYLNLHYDNITSSADRLFGLSLGNSSCYSTGQHTLFSGEHIYIVFRNFRI